VLARIDQSVRDLEERFVTAGGDVEALARMTSSLRARADRLRAEIAWHEELSEALPGIVNGERAGADEK